MSQIYKKNARVTKLWHFPSIIKNSYYFKKNNDAKFKRVLVLNNNKKTLPYGWNVALKEATGDAIVRVDAHSRFPKDFITNNVKEMKNGENIVGGHRISITSDNSRWQKLLLIAEESLFGSGIAKYRRQDKPYIYIRVYGRITTINF